jgi:hypothetical protein
MTASTTGPGELEIELGEGFSDDEVALLIDGQEIWRHGSVSTNWSVGIADVVRVAAPTAGAPTVEVRARGKAAVHKLGEPGAAARLRANLDPNGELHIDPATDEPVF